MKNIDLDIKVPIKANYPYLRLRASLDEKTGFITLLENENSLKFLKEDHGIVFDENFEFTEGFVDDYQQNRVFSLYRNENKVYHVDLAEYNKPWMNGQFYIDSDMPVDNFSFKFENGKELRVDFIGGSQVLLQEFTKGRKKSKAKTIFESHDRLFNGIPDMLEAMADYLRKQL